MRLLSKSVGKKELLERIGALEAENQHLQKEIEGNNLNSGALLNLILENEDLFFFIYSSNNQNLTFNIEPEIFFGIRINNKLEDLLRKVHNDDKEKVNELFKLNFSSKLGSCTFRLANLTETRDQRIFRITLRKQKVQELDDGDYLCTLQNVTKEVKSKKDIIKIKEKAEESDKLKNTLLSRISQYIRTPLNSIVGFAELLTIYDPGELQRKEFLDIIKRQSKTLLDVINDISEIARYSSGDIEIKKTPIDLRLVINELIIGCEQLRPEKRKEEVKLETSFPNDDGIKIFSDSGRIQQIVSNILNHVQGLIDRGIITIGYKAPDDGKIEIFVNDNNTFIPKEEQKNYFNKYASNDTENNSKYDESGIGLAIAKVVVKAMGGRIWIESSKEEGTSFRFVIPYEEIPKVDGESIEVDEINADEKNDWRDKVVLIVDDEEVNVMFLEAVIENTNAKTLYAKNGFEAVELCKNIPKIDLVLMDIVMPGMNGINATHEIRKFNTRVPIIAQTALNEDDDHRNCLEAGCNATITKPIEVEKLLMLMKRLLNDEI